MSVQQLLPGPPRVVPLAELLERQRAPEAGFFGQGAFRIETVNKVGYRLLVADGPSVAPNTEAGTSAPPAASRLNPL